MLQPKLAFKVWCLLLICHQSLAQTSIRFNGNGVEARDQDRIKIPIDDPDDLNDTGPPVDVGSEDFTIEFWIKGNTNDNAAGSLECGQGAYGWIYGNIIFDRDRYEQNRAFGISFGNGRVSWGLESEEAWLFTLCGTSNVLDDEWHHLAFQRTYSSGLMEVFLDGELEASDIGPALDLSYPDDGVPCGDCCSGQSCDFSDPYIVLGAEKHDAGASSPAFNGYFDELRISNVLRYNDTGFEVRTEPFETDQWTMGLYHFDEGQGTQIIDHSAAVAGPSHGFMNVGGSPAGPVWSEDSPFSEGANSVVTSILKKEDFISLHPNPAQSFITITVPQATVRILDLAGHVMIQMPVTRQADIPLHEFPSGVYLIRIDGAQLSQIQRLVKE